MIGLDHPNYAEAIKKRQIKGIVLASANDDELSDILRCARWYCVENLNKLACSTYLRHAV
jgi:hypothetical protein